jgi:protein-S-isoprenylcysteine O-methyltransferase Ste14
MAALALVLSPAAAVGASAAATAASSAAFSSTSSSTSSPISSPTSSATSSPTSSKRGLRTRLLQWRPPRIALGLALAALTLHGAVFGATAPWGRAALAGAGLVAAGLGWMLWAWARFRAAGTPIRPLASPRVLIDEGPFAFGRNPMYLGIAVALLGVALALGSPFVAAAATGFVTLVGAVHVPHEEARLKQAFGGWYSDYAARVRRWL